MLLSLLGCPAPLPLGPPSPASWEGELPSVGVDIAALDGPIGQVWVRSINTHGATTPVDSVEIQVEGVTRPVTLDANGVGMVELPVPGIRSVSAGGLEVQVASFGSDWPGLGGFSRGAPAPAVMLGEGLTAGEGAVFYADNTVWWTHPEAPPQVMLVTSAPIMLTRAAHIDADEVLDLAVATKNGVYLLRGSADRGFTYQARMTAPTPLISMDLGDADDDGIIDVVAVWGTGEGDLLDVWRGDGRFQFTAGPTRRLVLPPVGVTVADVHGEGNEISVSHTDGAFDQFYAQGTIFQPTGPLLDITLPIDGQAWSPGDFDGDGLDEVLFASAYEAGVPRRLSMVELGVEPRITTLDRDVSGHFSFFDTTDDGRPDVLWSEDGGAVVGVRHDGVEGIETTTVGRSRGGPLAMIDHRFMIAEAERWMWTRTTTTEDRFLRIAGERFQSPGVALRDGRFVVTELDGDGVPELISIREGGFDSQLRIRSVRPHVVDNLGSVVLAPQVEAAVDMALCDTVAWVLLESGLHKVEVSDPLHPELLGSVVIQGDAVACGPGPSGDAAVISDGRVVEISFDLQLGPTASAPGAMDLWLDELGVAVCTTEDCGVVRLLTVDGPAVFTGDPLGAQRDGIELPGRGAPVIADLDHNGVQDLVFLAEGELMVMRGTPDGFARPEYHESFETFVGPPGFADFDGDGFDDLWAFEPINNRLRISSSLTGAATPIDTGDTADTGNPGPHTAAHTGIETGTPVHSGDTSTSTGSTAHTGMP